MLIGAFARCEEVALLMVFLHRGHPSMSQLGLNRSSCLPNSHGSHEALAHRLSSSGIEFAPDYALKPQKGGVRHASPVAGYR